LDRVGSSFCSILNLLRSLFALFGSLLVPKFLKELFGTLSAKHPEKIPGTLAFAPHRPYGPGTEPCRRQIRSAPGPKAPKACVGKLFAPLLVFVRWAASFLTFIKIFDEKLLSNRTDSEENVFLWFFGWATSRALAWSGTLP
jgi:hypothetical protein